jgi:Uma2 family endonuclease
MGANGIIVRIPPLAGGDHLTVEEFERRYAAMPEVKKAELIEGVVYMPSPVSMEEHADQHFNLVTWLGVYRAHTPGVQGGDNATIRLTVGLNQLQPDACLRILPSHGGRTRTQSGYVEGAPELVAEVAASSASYDLHDKLDAYRRNGVKEYLVWRVEDEAIDWFTLRGGAYHRMAARGGVLKSKAFPGLWLDAPAMLRGETDRVLGRVQEGLASDAHRRFVDRLRRKHAAGGNP